MKTIRILSLLVIIAAIPTLLIGQHKTKAVETVKFTTSIDCQDCVNKIMTNLPQEKGIKDVKCDLKTKEVTVSYNKEKNNPAEIRKSIEKLGYTAKQVSVESQDKKVK
jgi:copper chaperone CopZ